MLIDLPARCRFLLRLQLLTRSAPLPAGKDISAFPGPHLGFINLLQADRITS
jgi:hypothetical protein